MSGEQEAIEELVASVMARGIRRIHVLAWRDLEDPDAGGSEVHADEFMRRWAAAGMQIVHRTSAAVGLPAESERHGYRVVRRGSRYSVFPRTIVSELSRADGSVGRARRDLERSALVLPGLVPPAPPHDPPPCPRPDVGPGHAGPAGRRRAVPRSPAGAAVLSAQRDRHAVGGDAGRAASRSASARHE